MMSRAMIVDARTAAGAVDAAPAVAGACQQLEGWPCALILALWSDFYRCVCGKPLLSPCGKGARPSDRPRTLGVWKRDGPRPS